MKTADLPVDAVFPRDAPAASIKRRLASLFYEVLLLAAILFIAGMIFALVSNNAQSPLIRAAFQAYLLLVAGAYFIGLWLRGGQTLPMKTWHLRLINVSGGKIGAQQAVLRYLLALVGIFVFGFGIIWALFDRDRQFWHDRMAGTRIVFLGKPKPPQAAPQQPV
ncbi:MAG: RDD family protein [Sulfuricellaceae bacterium]